MANDFTTLNNPKFLYLAELHQPFPDWVASEPLPERAEFTKKAATAFADPARRLLPICNKVAAFHSAINIFAQLSDFDEAAFDRVKEACAHYGIEKDVAPYANLFAEQFEKSASDSDIPEGRFAISTEIGGELFQMLPLNDAFDVSQSAFDLAKMASENRIHLLQVVEAAQEIVKAAADYEVTGLPELISRFGNERFPDLEKAASLIQDRERYCRNASIRAVVAADYADALQMVESDPVGAMTKIAAIDYQAGIVPNYRITAAVPTPFDIVYGGGLVAEAEKVASEHVSVLDVLVPLAEMQRIAPLEAEYKLSKSAAESFARLRDCSDARDISLAVERWEPADQRTLLRLAVAAAA